MTYLNIAKKALQGRDPALADGNPAPEPVTAAVESTVVDVAPQPAAIEPGLNAVYVVTDRPLVEFGTEVYDRVEFYWGQIDDDQRADIIAPAAKRACPWCRGVNLHHETCVELHEMWAVEMPWGKHKGRKLQDIDTDYLAWLEDRDINDDLREDVTRELDRRHDG